MGKRYLDCSKNYLKVLASHGCRYAIRIYSADNAGFSGFILLEPGNFEDSYWVAKTFQRMLTHLFDFDMVTDCGMSPLAD